MNMFLDLVSFQKVYEGIRVKCVDRFSDNCMLPGPAKPWIDTSTPRCPSKSNYLVRSCNFRDERNYEKMAVFDFVGRETKRQNQCKGFVIMKFMLACMSGSRKLLTCLDSFRAVQMFSCPCIKLCLAFVFVLKSENISKL